MKTTITTALLAVTRQVEQNAAMIKLEAKGYFITGADTDVGKTYVACEIVRQLCAQGVEVETRKPAESGCVESDNGSLITHDAVALQQANNGREIIERICPYRYRAAVAPHRAARLEHKTIKLQALIDACSRDDPTHCLIVEGAGGFYSPLAEDGLNADLASALQLPVIIVVNDRIGAVNQALMTLQAVISRKLHVAALILNQVEPPTDSGMDNAADIKSYCNSPLFTCGHNGELDALFEDDHV
ncbi:dethiobiotin synthase [Gammaproteobacteria bacterium]|nr:dethiobiotin synthase [Gammaproteobacteria bacterium]